MSDSDRAYDRGREQGRAETEHRLDAEKLLNSELNKFRIASAKAETALVAVTLSCEMKPYVKERVMEALKVVQSVNQGKG